MERNATHITAHGSIIGTPAYLSPEQARGHKLDHRTDIYSLGVVLYEMLTGKLPFDSNDISVLLLQKVTQDPLPPRELVPNLPPELNNAIMRALEKDPDMRFQSAADFARALGQREIRHPTVQTPAEVGSPDPDTKDMPTEEAAPAFDSSKPITVVVADDHVILRTSLVFYLDDQPDITVLAEAGDGDEVIRQCQQNPPNVLLLDLNMPGKGGLEVLPRVRRDCPQTRVLVLTGRTEDAYIMRALQLGAHGYMLKTSSQEELLEAVRKVAQGNMVLGTGVAERVVHGLISPESRDPLNEQERAVLLCVVGGYETNDAIAEKLGYTEQEVVEHLTNAINKLGAQSRSQAALTALRAGWITVDEAHQP
jgi:NarL family two-component system response regulator LiaR